MILRSLLTFSCLFYKISYDLLVAFGKPFVLGIISNFGLDLSLKGVQCVLRVAKHEDWFHITI